MIAALFVQKDGCYSGLPGIELWDEARDARTYAGPWRVVAHPPCQRWGRFWHGSTRKPHQFSLGDDGGCFAAAIAHLGCCEIGIRVHQRDMDTFGVGPCRR